MLTPMGRSGFRVMWILLGSIDGRLILFICFKRSKAGLSSSTLYIKVPLHKWEKR